MALFKSGTVILQSGTGLRSFSGLGFQPKFVMLQWLRDTGMNGNGVWGHYSVGVAVGNGALQQRVAGVSEPHPNVASSTATGTTNEEGAIIRQIHFSLGTVEQRAVLNTFDSDGFTINVTTSVSSNTFLHYFAIGGNVNAHTSLISAFTSPGTQTVNVGWRPKLVMFIGSGISNNPTYGWLTENGQAAIGRHRTTNTAVYRQQVLGRCIHVPKGVSGSTPIFDSGVGTITANGFQIEWVTKNSSVINHFVAIGGDFEAQVGSVIQPATPSVQFVETPNLRPGTIHIMTSGLTANAGAVTGDSPVRYGILTSAAQHMVGINSWVPGSVAVSFRNSRNADFIEHRDSNTVNVLSRAAGELAPNGFDVTWSVADGTPREYFYLALGDFSSNTAPAPNLTLVGPYRPPMGAITAIPNAAALARRLLIQPFNVSVVAEPRPVLGQVWPRGLNVPIRAVVVGGDVVSVKLSELGDVAINPLALQDKDRLVWDASSGVWRHEAATPAVKSLHFYNNGAVNFFPSAVRNFTINPVDTSKAMVVMTAAGSPGYWLAFSHFVNSTTVQFTTGAAANNVTVNFYVIEFN